MEQYIEELVPGHFTVRTNKMEITPGEIIRVSHTRLMEDASKWFKKTSESSSVVAAVHAGVSFAASTTVTGGVNTDKGTPAFQAFEMLPLMGLCFSVTSLIMFLSILTSRKEIKDFETNLPILLPIYMPATLYVITELPLYVDLVRAITMKVPLASDK
ncbi:hypothetical protein Fmac_027181 [Flemingia macrophylla]|uniref:PGG domain-containing protein n=1 Tax=Flemingia macrophylla TaxID=520843 RepID=A0ABD1LH40_9FABA